MSRNLDLRVAAEDASGSSEEELVPAAETKGTRRRAMFAAAAGVFCLLGACAFAAKALSMQQGHSLRASPQPITARALLESSELADLATDNVMAVGGDSYRVPRAEVHAAVARRLTGISDSIKEQYPTDHQKLETLTLSPEQKESVFKTLRHFGDHRMIALSGVVQDVVRETAQKSGDEVELKRRLTEKLQPHMGDIQALGQELFPGRHGSVALNFDNAPVANKYRKWHLQMQVSQPQQVAAARRLAEDDIGGSVAVQARSMFAKLQSMFGDEMPAAPARMLQSQTSTSGETGFVDCMMQQMSDMNIPGCLQCIMSNMSTVMQMVEQFMTGGGDGSSGMR